VAVLEGIQIASTLNRPIIIECDCQQVVNALNSRTWGRSHAGMVYAEIQQAVQTIQDLQVQKIPRSANGAAHTMAAYSRRTLSSGVMYSSAPACVLGVVEIDCNLDIPD
jgi:hypothetical protein